MTVTNFDHKVVDRLAHELAPALDDRGFVMANVTEVDNVERCAKPLAGPDASSGTRYAQQSPPMERRSGQYSNDPLRRVSKLTPPIGWQR